MDVSSTQAPVLDTLEERLAASRCAVLVIDMQNDFCAPGGYASRLGRDVSACRALVPRLERFIHLARTHERPVIWIMAQYDRSLIPRPMLIRKLQSSTDEDCCPAGSWGAAPYGVQPAAEDRVIVKHCYSGFYGTRLEEVLTALQVDTLIFTGVQTNVCVESTLRDAHSRGFYVVIAEDCVMSHMAKEHQASLSTISMLFGDVMTSERIVELWNGNPCAARADSKTPGGRI